MLIKFQAVKMNRRQQQVAREKARMAVRGQIVGLHKAGHCRASIGGELGVSFSTVNRWVIRYEEEATVLRRPSGAPPLKTSREEDAAIVAASSEDPFCPATRIGANLGLDCSINTVRRRLYQAGMHGKTPAEKPMITNEHRQARLQFCQDYQHYDMNFWKRVIFTDEKTFCSDSHRRRHVWRTRGSRYNPVNFSRNKRSGRISVGMWGWMSFFGPGELLEVGGRLTGQSYVQILDSLVASVRVMQVPEPEHIYVVHDRSPIHMCRVVQEWQNNHPEVQFLPWPPKGADLNPIENLWSLMVEEWELRRPPTPANLVTHCVDVWENFRRSPALFENLVSSMPSRLQKCIDAGGDFTKY